MGSMITVDSVIREYLNESEQGLNKYAKLAQIAYRGMDDLGIDFFYEVKTVVLPINENGTANIPPNINWTKIGVFDSNGGFIPLSYNFGLTTYGSFRDNRKALNDGSGFNLGGYSISSPTFYNYGNGMINGYGWSTAYNFQVDERNGIILFDNWSNIGQVAIELMCAPTEGEEYYIPLVFKEPLVEWMGWREIKHLPRSRRGDIGEKRDRKHDYYNARRLAFSRYKPFNLEQAKMT